MTLRFSGFNSTVYYAEDLTTVSASFCPFDAEFKFNIYGDGDGKANFLEGLSKISDDKDPKGAAKLQKVRVKRSDSSFLLNEENTYITWKLKSRDLVTCNIDIEGVLDLKSNDKKYKIMSYSVFGLTLLILNIFCVVSFVNKFLMNQELALSVSSTCLIIMVTIDIFLCFIHLYLGFKYNQNF